MTRLFFYVVMLTFYLCFASSHSEPFNKLPFSLSDFAFDDVALRKMWSKNWRVPERIPKGVAIIKLLRRTSYHNTAEERRLFFLPFLSYHDYSIINKDLEYNKLWREVEAILALESSDTEQLCMSTQKIEREGIEILPFLLHRLHNVQMCKRKMYLRMIENIIKNARGRINLESSFLYGALPLSEQNQ